MTLKKLQTKELPKAPKLIKMIGPSFIILGLGLGSGEVILWPFLTSNYGMGVIWGAILGLTFQFFMNMEIERYALAHGESVFVGFARKLKWLPVWFLFSTFLPWIWPGIVAASAKLFGHVVGVEDSHYIAIGFLLLMGAILSLGPVLYKTVENFQKMLILVGVPSIFVISIILTGTSDWIAAFKGLAGIGVDEAGRSYNFLPVGLPIATFLAALAYAGAGGNLNLAQSFYVKDKGFGMGKYAGRIQSLITGKAKRIELTGAKFNPTKENLSRFNKWWRNVNIEHFIVFWLTGSITILLLAVLAYSTTFGSGLADNINFVIGESEAIATVMWDWLGTFFLLVVALTLFGTQMTVFDATARIISENILLLFPKMKHSNLSKVYYAVLWLMILSGISIFLLGFTEPLQLIIIAAVMNAFAMFVHVGLTLWMNKTLLHKSIQPSKTRTYAMVGALLFYGGFSIFVILNKLGII